MRLVCRVRLAARGLGRVPRLLDKVKCEIRGRREVKWLRGRRELVTADTPPIKRVAFSLIVTYLRVSPLRRFPHMFVLSARSLLCSLFRLRNEINWPTI